MQQIGTHKKQTAGTLLILSVFFLFFSQLYVPGVVIMSHADSIKATDQKKSVSDRNLIRWKSMSEGQKNRFRKLNEQYQSMPVEQQTLLKRNMETFNKLPKKVRHLILNNYKMLKVLSEDNRKSFFRLIKNYQKLPPNKRNRVHKAFKKVRTLPKAKQLEFFYLLIEENTKQNPAIRKVIKKFLIKAGLSASDTKTSN
jgi:hypothetical protein